MKRSAMCRGWSLRLGAGWPLVLISACAPLSDKGTRSGEVASYRDATFVQSDEIPNLKERAAKGDEEALFRLARHYQSFAPRLDEYRDLLEGAYRKGNARAGKALVDFYSLFGGEFRPTRALSIHRSLRLKNRAVTVSDKKWAEMVAHEYSLYDKNDEATRRYAIFHQMAVRLRQN